MRKHELVHLHALARTVADDLIERGDLDPAALSAYAALGVTPVSLQASRDDHEAALLALVAAVADAVAVPADTADGATTADGTTTAGGDTTGTGDGDGDTGGAAATDEDLAEAADSPRR